MDKTQEAFLHLINKQLEPYGLTYEDIKNSKTWYEDYTTTEEQQQEFMDYGIDYLRKKLRYNKKMAERTMGFFIFGYGLKTKK